MIVLTAAQTALATRKSRGKLRPRRTIAALSVAFRRGPSYQVDARERQDVKSFAPDGAAGPTWMPPSPYGAPAAIEMMGSVAAPLLAGFSLTLLILVITNPDAFRWPGLVLVAFAVSAVTLISVVQFTFWARSYRDSRRAAIMVARR